MFCCTADGKMLPPMTVYKSLNSSLFLDWCQGGPPGAVYAASKSGWFNMDLFNKWFAEVPLVYFKTLPPEDEKVMIGDNLASHLSPEVLALCEQHNIKFMFLPENSTHLLQPLDVTVFRPMKGYWRQLLRKEHFFQSVL